MSEFVIGQEYERPTVCGMPVLLPGHDDKELPCVDGNEIFHYHYDWRFIAGIPAMNSAIRGSEPHMYLHRCWREQHPWNPGLIFATYTLMMRYRDACVKSGRCPHRGAEIDKTTGQCPAHGLLFDLNTGHLKHKAEDCEYKAGTARIACRGTSFQVVMPKACDVRHVDMVCGDTIIARHVLPQDIKFGEGDRFQFKEICKDQVIEASYD